MQSNLNDHSLSLASFSMLHFSTQKLSQNFIINKDTEILSPKDYTHHSIYIRGSFCSQPSLQDDASICTTLKASDRSVGHRDCHEMHPHKPTSHSIQTRPISAIYRGFCFINITQNMQQLVGIALTHCYNKLGT